MATCMYQNACRHRHRPQSSSPEVDSSQLPHIHPPRFTHTCADTFSQIASATLQSIHPPRFTHMCADTPSRIASATLQSINTLKELRPNCHLSHHASFSGTPVSAAVVDLYNHGQHNHGCGRSHSASGHATRFVAVTEHTSGGCMRETAAEHVLGESRGADRNQ